MHVDYSFRTIEVKCQRDPDFTRSLTVCYWLLKDNKLFYISAECKKHSKTETCYRCCNAVVNLLNKGEQITPGKPLTPQL